MSFSPADWPCIGFDHPSEQSSRPLLGFLALELICSLLTAQHVAVYRAVQHSTAQRIVHCASHTSGRLHRKLGVRRQMQVIVVHTGACRLNDNGV